MKLWSKLILTVAVPVAVWLVDAPLATPQAAAQPKGPMSEVTFKNIQVSWVKEGLRAGQWLFSCGANDYITKPFNPMEVTARVARYLPRKKP